MKTFKQLMESLNEAWPKPSDAKGFTGKGSDGKQTGNRHNIETKDGVTKVTRKYDPKTGESDEPKQAASGEAPVKRGRGRPPGKYGSYKKKVKESIEMIESMETEEEIEEFIESLDEESFEELHAFLEEEQLEELSKETLSSYNDKALSAQKRHWRHYRAHDQGKGVAIARKLVKTDPQAKAYKQKHGGAAVSAAAGYEAKKHDDRVVGRLRAKARLAKENFDMTEEEFEQIEELSLDTLKSYRKKALPAQQKRIDTGEGKSHAKGLVASDRKIKQKEREKEKSIQGYNSKPHGVAEETDLEEMTRDEFMKGGGKSPQDMSDEGLAKHAKKPVKGPGSATWRRLINKEKAKRAANEEVDQIEEMDRLALRGLHSANPQSVPDYKRSTEAGKKSVAKKNLPDLKNAIKSSLGKHTKPVLPEEVEIEEGVGKDYSASPAGYKDQPKEKLQSVGGDGYKRNRHIKDLQQLLSSVDTKYPITHAKNKTVLDKIHSKLKKLDEEVEHIEEISDKAKLAYLNVASKKAGGARAMASLHREIGDEENAKKYDRKSANREKGIARAVAPVKKHFGMKEETEPQINESLSVDNIAAFISNNKE